MNNTIVGTVIAVMQVESCVSKAGNAWKNQSFVVETSEQYPKKICFTMLEKNPMFCGIAVTMDVEVSYNLESREFNGKWYTNNPTAWKIDVINKLSQATPTHQNQDAAHEFPPVPNDDIDNLPF